jgi:hypothetical protein
MNDTPAKIAKRFRQLLMRRSGQERLKMGCSMYAASKALVRAALLRANPNASQATVRRQLFLRFYGQDFEPAARKRILAALAKSFRERR